MILDMVQPTLRWFMGYLQRSSLVKRYHNITLIREDVVGRHSANVAWICWLLADREPTTRLLMAALEHDQPEGVSSDVSASFKWLVPAIEPLLNQADDRIRQLAGTLSLRMVLTKKEELILEFADKLEALLFTWHESKALGNYGLRGVHDRYDGWVGEMIKACPPEYQAIAVRAAAVRDAIHYLYLKPETEEDYIHEQSNK